MQVNINSLLERAGSILYPHTCLHCDAAGQGDMDLCTYCYANLPWIKYACKRCALPLAVENSSVCGACSNRKIYFNHAFVPFLYDQVIRESIHQFKFNHKLNHGELLATLLFRQIQKQQIAIPDILIPVPLHRDRIRKRGFNQALEIARTLSKHISCTISTKDIRRTKATHAQMNLPAAKRQANVKNAFQLNPTHSNIKDKHIAIIDDVMTTGSTVNEVAKCLQKIGAKRIDVWCMARVA